MYFQHSPEIWAEHPELVAGVLYATGIPAEVSVDSKLAKFHGIAEKRLAAGTESEFPEIRAWRRAFAKMGLKPTQYRCASESLLRRFRKERELPRIHPLIDLCNAVSLAFAIPVAALDVTKISGSLEVRHATGDESYQTFSGATEHPEPHEVIFADDARRAHARRWTNRQSGYSAVADGTTTVLIVAEALHETALADVAELTAELAVELTDRCPAKPRTAVLTPLAPRFDLPGQAGSPG